MPRVLKIKLLQEYSYDYKEGDERILNIKDFVIIFSLVKKKVKEKENAC